MKNMKEKLTVELATKAVLAQRAREDAVSIGTYLDRLITRDDLRRRIAADRVVPAAAGLDRPRRIDQLSASALLSRHPQAAS